jgi:hypothetical protein
MGITYNPRTITDGLVLCLDAGNPKSYPGSGTTWTDLSGNGNNGTLVNGPTYSSSNGGNFNFDETGTNEYVSTSISNFFTSYSQQITMEAWVYIPSSATWSNGYYGNIFTRGNFSGSHGLWRSSTNNRVLFYCRQLDPFDAQNSFADISRDTWYQLVGVWDAGTKIYVNGELIDSDSASFTGETQNNENEAYGGWGSFKIGQNSGAAGAGGNYFTGNQAAHKIYNRALTPQEIKQNFNATRSRFSI